MRDHRKLRAFELADNVARLVYRVTRSFPREEIYGLTSQMRRATVSAASNIVEGCAREGEAEYRHFLQIAFGSLRELHYQVDLSIHLGYLKDRNATICGERLLETEKVLGALIRSMRSTTRGD